MNEIDGLKITPPVRWYGLGPDDAVHVWGEVVPWVHWMVNRFAIPATAIPPCWHAHPRLVEELTALWTAYEVMYDETSPGSSPVSWLRELEWTIGRIRAAVKDSGCTPREHREDRIEYWMVEADYEQSLRESKKADFARRERELAMRAATYFATEDEPGQ